MKLIAYNYNSSFGVCIEQIYRIMTRKYVLRKKKDDLPMSSQKYSKYYLAL